MTRARLTGIWLFVLVGGFVLTFTNLSREYRLLVSEGDSAAETVWGTLGQELLMGFLIASVFLVPMTLFGLPGKLNQLRVARKNKADSDELVVGVWRANPQPDVKNGAPGFSGMAAIATTLIANPAGLHLVRGFGSNVEPWRVPWESVDEVNVEFRTAETRSAFGPVVCIRTTESVDPIRLYVVDQNFPWFAAAGAEHVSAVVEELMRIRQLQE